MDSNGREKDSLRVLRLRLNDIKIYPRWPPKDLTFISIDSSPDCYPKSSIYPQAALHLIICVGTLAQDILAHVSQGSAQQFYMPGAMTAMQAQSKSSVAMLMQVKVIAQASDTHLCSRIGYTILTWERRSRSHPQARDTGQPTTKVVFTFSNGACL